MDKPLAIKLFRGMIRVRLIEEAIADLYAEQQMRCPVHLSIGQEAAAVGVCEALEKSDYALSSHRSHSHYLAKGGDLKAMMAELYGKATGCSQGKGGSMHLVDLAVGFLGATPIVGSTIPIGVGAALASAMKNERRVTAVFFGEGATEEGVFHESVNFAMLKKLPVLFVCENNLYSVYSPLSVRQPADRSVMSVAAGHGIKSVQIDGNDIDAVYTTVSQIVKGIRAGHGPAFCELATYRWREHCGPNYDNDLGYRTREEFETWKARCPIESAQKKLIAGGYLNEQLIAQMHSDIKTEIQGAVEFARKSPFPDRSELGKNIFCAIKGPVMSERNITYQEAIREALDVCMGQDPSVYVMGLGVPDPKGVFGTTLGLQKKYGNNRVMDMPTSENGMTGVAIGSALVGMRPVITHQRVDFALLSVEQIVNQAAKWHYMFGGQMKVPMVIRLIIGRGWGQGPQHSQSFHGFFSHVPGLKVVMPTTASEAKGMLIASIEDDNPVIFIEHRWLHSVTGPVPSGYYRVPLGEARVVREGRDVTIVSLSYMTLEAIRAADELKARGIDAEIIDIRSLSPFDETTVLTSVKKTGRLVMAELDWKTGGFGAEVVAGVVEKAFRDLKAAPRRVALPDCPTPTSPALAAHYYPRSPHLVLTVCEMLGKSTAGISFDADPFQLDVPDKNFKGPF